MSDLTLLVSQATEAFEAATDPAALENAKARFLGKAGLITEQLKALAALDPESRKAQGALVNQAKVAVEQALNARRSAMAHAALQEKLSAEAIDVTLPGRAQSLGSIHPVIRTWRRVVEIFASIGFDVADGPEIETDWFNFTSLNNPLNHPARSMQDTFYVDQVDESGLPLLHRTHNSP
ncbi:MAG: phenylalanine--tRNA ligase subunit alpha, partial [Burkholderiaceae bacterium]